MQIPRSLTAALVTVAFGIGVGVPAAAQATTAPPAPTSSAALLTDTLTQALAAMTRRTDTSDLRYFSDGAWLNGDDRCWRCNLGPGVAAAALAATADATYLPVAVATVDRAVRVNQQADGSFGPPMPGEGGNGIQTSLGVAELAEIYLVLGDRVDTTRRDRWRASLVRAVDYLDSSGSLRWYTNGNIVAANALATGLVAKITGTDRSRTLFEGSLTFATNPSQTRWPGLGLRYTTTPTRADGADGAGYLTESSSTATGYDPEYTQMQLDVFTRLFVLTADPRALRLSNLLWNQIRQRVNTTTWTLDASNGSRHTDAVRLVTLTSSGPTVLAVLGGRADLGALYPSQLKVVDGFYRGSGNTGGIGEYYGFGTEATTAFLALNRGWTGTSSPLAPSTVASARVAPAVTLVGRSLGLSATTSGAATAGGFSPDPVVRVGTYAQVMGRLPSTAAGSTAALLARSAGRWVEVARAQVDGDGRVSFVNRLRFSMTYRVRVVGTSLTTPDLDVTVIPDEVLMAASSTLVRRRSAITLGARLVSAVPAGRTVSLMRLNSGRWTTVASAVTDRSGRASFTTRVRAATVYRLDVAPTAFQTPCSSRTTVVGVVR